MVGMSPYTNVSELISKLRLISPAVSMLLDGERYRLFIDQDDITDDTLMVECLYALRDELFEIGIELIDEDILCLNNDIQQLYQFIYILEYILPAPLYEHLKNEPFLRDVVKNLLEEQKTSEDGLLFNYCGFLGGLNGDTPYTSGMDIIPYVIETFKSNAMFDHYMTKLLAMVNDETGLGDTTSLTPEEMLKYTNYLTIIRSHLNEIIIPRLKEKLTLSDKENIFKKVQFNLNQTFCYYNNTVNVKNLYVYHFLSTDNKEINLLKQKTKKELRCSSPVFPEYYKIRRFLVGEAELLSIVCWIIRPYMDSDKQIQRKVDLLVELYPYFKEMILTIGSIMLDYYYETLDGEPTND